MMGREWCRSHVCPEPCRAGPRLALHLQFSPTCLPCTDSCPPQSPFAPAPDDDDDDEEEEEGDEDDEGDSLTHPPQFLLITSRAAFAHQIA